MTNMNQLRIFIAVLLVFLNGCTFLGLPWQFSAASTAGDLISAEATGKTLSENGASLALKKDCQWGRVAIGWPPCLTKEEFIDKLIEMDCKTYSWNFLNIPYCRESKTNV